MKEAVQVVILNKDGEVLAVSRKHDHNDFGLVGGKVDEGETLIEAIIRETKEETGLTIYKKDLIQIFSMHRDNYMGYTYLIDKYDGEIETDEPHVVKWTTFDEIIRKTFGKWNKMVAESLESMGVKFKLHDNNCLLCKNTGIISVIVNEDDDAFADTRKCNGIKHLDRIKFINKF